MNRIMLAVVTATALASAGLAGDDKRKPTAKPPATQAEVIDHLPIKQAKDEREFRVDEGHWVYLEKVQISQAGDTARIDGELTGINRTVFCGFHAAAIVTLYDGRDNVIGKHVVPEMVGVNGTILGGSSGTKTFTIDLTKEQAQKVRRFEVKGYQSNHPNFIEEVEKIGGKVKKMIGGGQSDKK